ncbi:hypothetical protein EGW08_023053 [Elysia chlorotica]|uniref:Biotin carboxyl carrier protein of acetyl-CoA carboxylase n=1 Tax=Elysia chlorotica TaxID=188477 RepID=A0A433SJE2_ELYCH|nr:hypothetical protein EGW08_023053 [Elysia chlorotica]
MDLLKAIDRVAEILETSDIKEIRVKDGGSCIFMTKNEPTANVVAGPVATHAAAPVSAPAATSTATSSAPKAKTAAAPVVEGDEFKSPMVGTFYGASSPDAPAYVTEGKSVKKGDVLCIIEAMKIMNKIEAEKDGKIVKILAKDGDPIQFDQPLFIIA